ncbi:MAG: right-handed parallel beta-helix repeat-containing protein, partial [Acidobacteria bacterium]|nr:right-handed parallel beta-helix repeat-containing protein [Acidobacteriota bacterium]
EHNGLTLHVRLPGDANPAEHEVELVIQEQVFAPRRRELGYIRVKGITFEYAANGFPGPQRGLVSTNSGHHWIIEDCTIRHANSVGLDIGYQDGSMEPPKLVGYSIVRRNHIDDAGVCGLAGLGVCETLIESNLIEHIGWQNVELMWETSGIKLHLTKNCLLRHNVIRHVRYAGAIWLDYQNVNTRVTGNVMGDLKDTLRGGIYLEASHEPNMLDHNIIWDTTEGPGGGTYNMPPHGGWGILVDGSDEAVIAHNLFGFCQDAAVKTRTVESRIVGTRGGTSRWNQVLNNIFYRCGKAIDFCNRENMAEGNLYWFGADQVADENRGVGRGLNWISSPEPVLRLDLPAWQKFFGFDKKGAYADMSIDVNLDTLRMTWSVSGTTPVVEAGPHFQRDLLGRISPPRRKPGPLLDVPGEKITISIDPRAVTP